eukprot:3336968-Pleurochrysis_carterae.AAC.6
MTGLFKDCICCTGYGADDEHSVGAVERRRGGGATPPRRCPARSRRRPAPPNRSFATLHALPSAEEIACWRSELVSYRDPYEANAHD